MRTIDLLPAANAAPMIDLSGVVGWFRTILRRKG